MDGEEGGSGSGLDPAWAKLPDDCLVDIFSGLSPEDLWRRAMFVCKSWLNVCRDSRLHSVFDLETYFDSVTESARHWTPEFERTIDSMLRSVVVWSEGSLTEIRVRHCSDRSLSLVAERCPNLEVLSVQSSPHVTDAAMNEIASRCPNLRELDISYCYEISPECLAFIGSHCPHLQILKRNLMNWLDHSEYLGIVPLEYLNACPEDGDSDAAAIGNFMPQLLYLEIRFSKLTGKGLALISNGCSNLEYLDRFGCTNVASEDVAAAVSRLLYLERL